MPCQFYIQIDEPITAGTDHLPADVALEESTVVVTTIGITNAHRLTCYDHISDILARTPQIVAQYFELDKIICVWRQRHGASVVRFRGGALRVDNFRNLLSDLHLIDAQRMQDATNN